ncbi:MAG: DNA polymerase III subunit gamma/tau [Candidatus Omnitrophota bacterium]
MSYKVFALKWRPNNFDEIIGQSHIVNALKNAIKEKRLANAYLFAGPRGVGKTSTARILAKALNCKEGLSFNPCGKCSSCVEISQSRSLDVLEIDGASNTGVDDVRTLRENVKFSPVLGKFKVYIIDEVHMLSTSAFNALLKTLEEPPEFVKFIFATTSPDKIPATVLSRCHRFDFRRITAAEITSQLEKIVKAENIKVDREVLFAIAKASDGALRDAESMLDQLVSFSKDRVSLKDITDVLGLVEQELLFEITDKIIQKDPDKALELLNKIIDEGKDTNIFLSSLIEHFRNLMVAKVTKGDIGLIDLSQEDCERLLRQSQSFSLEEIFNAFNILSGTHEMLKRLELFRIPLEVSIVRLCHIKKPAASSLNEKETKEDNLRADNLKKKEPIKRTGGVNNPNLASEAGQKSVSATNITLDNIKSLWKKVIESLSEIKISAANYLSQGEPFNLKGDLLTVAFPKSYSFYKESLERKENREIVERNLASILNTRLRVTFVFHSEDLKNKPEDSGGSFIRSVMDVFGGRVVKEE